MARTLIELAAKAGADAVKFQTFKPETVYVKGAGTTTYLSKAGLEEPIGELFRDLVLDYDMLPELAEHARAKGIEFMSTPFSLADLEAVDPHVKRHKIASYEISHAPLIAAAAVTLKPLILSTGAAELPDIEWAINHFRENGGRDLTLMQCTAQYPAPHDSLNLKTIQRFGQRFGLPVGLSDHSRDPIVAPVAAVALGARIIEKHFTLDNRLPGPDHPFAVTPDELEAMVRSIRRCEDSLGTGEKVIHDVEKEHFLFGRRTVQAARAIVKGDILKLGVNMDILRPGDLKPGIHPRHLPLIEGRPAARDIPQGHGITLDDAAG
jgi:N-acetylneuraminate synthase